MRNYETKKEYERIYSISLKTVKMEELNTKILLNEQLNINADSPFDENKIPYGITDSDKLSTEYLEFTTALKINEHSNSEILKLLLTLLIILYYSASSNVNRFIEDSKDNFDYNQENSREFDIKAKVAYAYFVERLCSKSISSYFKLNILNIMKSSNNSISRQLYKINSWQNAITILEENHKPAY